MWVVWANSQFATVWGVFFSFIGFFAKATGRTLRQICTNEGSKRIVPLIEVCFGGLAAAIFNFG